METVIKELMFEYYKRTEIDFQFWIRDNYEYLLKKEKEQIIKAHENGQAEFDSLHYRDKNVRLSNNYYNQTYNQNKS
jgi:hypothetical protein